MQMDDSLYRSPGWMKRIHRYLTGRKVPAKLVIIVISVFATLWVLIRVLPKPSRAAYPCMIVLSPVVTGFVTWLFLITGSGLAFRKAKHKLMRKKYFTGIVLLLVGITLTITLITKNPELLKADIEPWYQPNIPVGEARGIFPGRIAWTHNPSVATWDGKTGFWWEEQHTDQSECNKLLNDALLLLTSTTSEQESWEAIFRYFNQTRKGLDQGYRKHEKIAIKINQNNTGSHENNNEINTTPHLVFSTLSSLINQANVPQENRARN